MKIKDSAALADARTNLCMNKLQFEVCDIMNVTGCNGCHSFFRRFWALRVDRYTSHETFSTCLTLCTHHIVAQGVTARVWQNHSCTCHHMFERSLSILVLSSSSPSRASTFSLTVFLFSVLHINFRAVGRGRADARRVLGSRPRTSCSRSSRQALGLLSAPLRRNCPVN